MVLVSELKGLFYSQQAEQPLDVSCGETMPKPPPANEKRSLLASTRKLSSVLLRPWSLADVAGVIEGEGGKQGNAPRRSFLIEIF